jgi:hypothetical protein
MLPQGPPSTKHCHLSHSSPIFSLSATFAGKIPRVFRTYHVVNAQSRTQDSTDLCLGSVFGLGFGGGHACIVFFINSRGILRERSVIPIIVCKVPYLFWLDNDLRYWIFLDQKGFLHKIVLVFDTREIHWINDLTWDGEGDGVIEKINMDRVESSVDFCENMGLELTPRLITEPFHDLSDGWPA